MQNKPIRLGPVALTTTLTTNIFNVPTTTGGTGLGTPSLYILIKHLRIVNKTVSAATASLWIGATAGNVAGTEVIVQGTSIAANSYLDAYFPNLRMDVADFMVGGAGTTLALTLQGEAEMGIA